jgi:hypothetical protein
MTGSRGLPVVSLRSGRWLLPWISVLVISATLAYAANSAASGPLAIGEREPDVELARATDGATIAPALEHRPRWRRRQIRTGSLPPSAAQPGFIPVYVGVDWIVAEDRRIACKHPAP